MKLGSGGVLRSALPKPARGFWQRWVTGEGEQPTGSKVKQIKYTPTEH